MINEWFVVMMVSSEHGLSAIARVWKEDCLKEVRYFLPSLKKGTRIYLSEAADSKDKWEYVVQ